jgi:hypothetical protein
MPKSRGEQRRALKQRRRREARRKARAAPPKSAREAGEGSSPGYHPERTPESGWWLALSESQRLDLIEAYHQTLPPERQPPSLTVHTALHAMVETQLAMAEPAVIRAALDRLRQGGLRRHDAIHAIGWIAAEHLKNLASGSGDPAAYAQTLAELTPERWRQLATRLGS